MAHFLNKILGDPYKKELRRMQKTVDEINGLEERISKLSDDDIRRRVTDIKKDVAASPDIKKFVPEVFALTREAGKRATGMRMFDVQLIGGISLVNTTIAEMKTGEGKTLVASAALVLYALTGKGAHLVTVNDYLARRDAVWMGKIYAFLGLSVGCIQHDRSFIVDYDYENTEKGFDHLRPVSRKEAYDADITYGTNNEFGFDYLRDNMAQDAAQRVQRELHFAIVDEVDSILIDEARTPLIISAPAEEATSEYQRYARLVQQLKENEDYNVDEKAKAATLTEKGMSYIEKALGIDTIYDTKGIRTAHHIEQALKAKTLFKKDRDYTIRDGEVVIVDQFTGRLMTGRRYSGGLHQAIEAKENVQIQRENRTFATITFQNYFRLYENLSGMTGTAETEAEEFAKIYHLDVNVIPTNKPIIRKDYPDYIFKTEDAKFRAIIADVQARQKKGQPVLIGTVAIEKSEELSAALRKAGIKHNVLNAKYHQKEAEVIAQAGSLGAVTISTNMAGRGTDIVLGGEPYNEALAQKVRDLGGLYVIGTERHESRRIDNQLRGRSGRQGDPGETRFFVSLEDNLLRIFGSDRLKSAMNLLNLPDDQPIENKMITRSLESAQKRVEGHHFDARKHLVEYDDVINTHREVIYKRRAAILDIDPHTDVSTTMIWDIITAELHRIIDMHAPMDGAWNTKELQENLITLAQLSAQQQKKLHDILHDTAMPPQDKREKTEDALRELLRERYREVSEQADDEVTMHRIERAVMLRTIDVFWVEHLEHMTALREGIGLQGYGQRDPLLEYKKRSYDIFQQLLMNIDHHIANTIYKVKVQPVQRPDAKETTAMAADKKSSNRNDIVAEKKKVGRNDPCPCGSGKKYKKCHGA